MLAHILLLSVTAQGIRNSLSLHRMKPDHVAFRVINEGDKAVLSNGLFWPLNSSAVLNCAGCFDRAVTAGKINDGAAGSRVLALHFDQCAGASGIGRLPQWRERP